MIRERRSKDKLQQYYRKFAEAGVIDPNVHPWVAESWKRSRDLGVPPAAVAPKVRLTRPELEERRQKHQPAIDYLDSLFNEIREHFNIYNLSLLLLDQECYALKNYALPFFQNIPGEIEGVRLTEADIGTSSISIVFEHKAPFLLFGPEMWIQEGQAGDACSAPVIVNGKLEYIITLVSLQQGELPYSSLIALLLSMRHAMERHLAMLARMEAKHAILDVVPLAVYHVLPDGGVAYTNRLGLDRLRQEGRPAAGKLPSLSEVVLNFNHTPLYKGFKGIPSYNKEVAWITPNKTYEDITTVVPLWRDRQVNGVVAVSLPIDDLRTLIAHATGYSARYSLASMVGKAEEFVNIKERAARAARSDKYVLLQGEPGTGKQRLAHGIHQASSRAAGPLIVLRCGEIPPAQQASELFGTGGQGEIRQGKLELANGGTLFLDEVEKLTAGVADRLADILEAGRIVPGEDNSAGKLDVRVIAACDSDLKRLADKGIFSAKLYELVARMIIRVPSLKQRAEDIPLLAGHIIAELAEQNNTAVKSISPEAVARLKAYNWPGNIKQLQGVIEQAFFSTDEDTIKAKDIVLPKGIGVSRAWKEDKEAFLEAWKAAGGNISRLAHMLDVSRVTLYRYLRKHGLDRE